MLQRNSVYFRCALGISLTIGCAERAEEADAQVATGADRTQADLDVAPAVAHSEALDDVPRTDLDARKLVYAALTPSLGEWACAPGVDCHLSFHVRAPGALAIVDEGGTLEFPIDAAEFLKTERLLSEEAFRGPDAVSEPCPPQLEGNPGYVLEFQWADQQTPSSVTLFRCSPSRGDLADAVIGHFLALWHEHLICPTSRPAPESPDSARSACYLCHGACDGDSSVP